MLEAGIKKRGFDFIPVRMLNEFVYCPRLAYLEWVYGEFRDNKHVIEGDRRHKSIDEKEGKIPRPDELFKDFRIKNITLSSQDFNIISKIDIVEGNGKEVYPVEIKKGTGPDKGVWPADRVQIGAQMLLLDNNGYNCKQGYVYYSQSNRKEKVPFDDKLLSDLTDAIRGIIESVDKEILPPPLVDNRKCEGCSLAGICLPDETNLIENVTKESDARILYPARDDASPLFVQEQGAYVKKRGDEILITKKGETLGKVRILDVSHICLFGNIQITTQTVNEMIDRGIPICYFSYGGWFRGFTQGMHHKNVQLRIAQFRTYDDVKKRTHLAKMMIDGKIKNCRTLLRRNSDDVKDSSLKELKRLSEKVRRCRSMESLLGLEGGAARIYFMNFSTMIKSEMRGTFDMKSRNKRPPKDPVNTLLSFCYSMLSKDMTITGIMVGLDPYLGFYHTPKYGRPAFGLDLMEEFRPLVADSVVISCINNEEIRKEDFIIRGNMVSLNKDGRKKLIRCYERRMNQLIKHPMFGYRVSYRRIFELQARILSRYLTGEIEKYIPFVTR